MLKKDDFRFGRYVIATRNIEKGEILFEEEPLEYGPNHINDVLACVACGREIKA